MGDLKEVIAFICALNWTNLFQSGRRFAVFWKLERDSAEKEKKRQ